MTDSGQRIHFDLPFKVARALSFSSRTNWETGETPWAAALVARQAGGLPVYDLTSGNPTQCGFHYDPALLDALVDPCSLRYAPDPRGLSAARLAVCGYYKEHIAWVRAALLSEAPTVEAPTEQQVVLTTSTSEAYSFLFRLLCDPGDEVLIAQPSYPLFDFLAVLDDVKLVAYPLFYDHGWHLDLHALLQKISARTRAIIIVHPNNPTGNFTTGEDRRALEQIAVQYGLALIIDEVFLDYSFEKPVASFVTDSHPALTFVMSGLSKIAGLPQMKLSWIVACGPEEDLKGALNRLEVIADTFLSVPAPIQHALPIWLAGRGSLQTQISARVAHNLAELDDQLTGADLVARLQMDGGWYVVVRIPAVMDGQELALQLLQATGVAVHPGHLFGMASNAYIVISLLTHTASFREGVARLLAFVATSTPHSPQPG